MGIATPEVYAEMLNRAKEGKFAYPAINVTSSQTLNAALRGFTEAESDGIIQISVGGAEYASGPTVKDRVAGSLAIAAYAREVAKNYPVTVALHTDHCAKQNIDSWVRPLLELEAEEHKAGRLPFFQSHMWDGSAVPLAENLEIAQELLALDMDSYELVGYCIGGFFALETAKILTELGRRVCRVVAVSTHLCPHRIANEMLCEFAYGCVVEADPRALGADFSIELLREGLEHILGGQNRDITDEELCALDGRYASLGSYFSACSRMSPKHRRRRIYETVKGYENDAGSARAMLEILYDVFRHSLRGTIGYRPDVYLGTVLALQPERGVDGFYPSLGGDVDWPSTVLGQLRTGIISGSHSDCLTEENYRSILTHFEQDQGD